MLEDVSVGVPMGTYVQFRNLDRWGYASIILFCCDDDSSWICLRLYSLL